MSKIPSQINNRGRRHLVTGRLRLGRRDYYVLDNRLNSRRSKYCVFDPQAGPQGELRALHVLCRNRRAHDYVEVVRRVSEGNVNLPKLIEYHQMHGKIYLLLTWIHGRVLHEYLDRCRQEKGPQPDGLESFKLFRGLAHGLRHMHHKKNFVHGDIRPENLVLCREPNRLVLIDFGNAWPVERTASRSRGDGVSEFYNAPEQLRDNRFVDFRSDQFSATVVFYEMLTLDLPYEGLGGKAGIDDFHEASLRHALTVPSRSSSDRSRLPQPVWKRIDRVVQRGLALRPEARYPNAQAWLRDIDAIHAILLKDTGLSALHELVLRPAAWIWRNWPTRQPK